MILSRLKIVEPCFSIARIGSAYERRFGSAFTFQGEHHNWVEMVFVAEGCVEIAENEHVYLLESDDMIIHAPLEFHRIRSAKNTAPKVYNLSLLFSGNEPPILYDGVFSLDEEGRNAFLHVFSLARTFIGDESGSRLAAQEAADSLSLFLLRLAKTDKNHAQELPESGVQMYKNVVKSMRAKLDCNLTLEELAQINHISVSYLKVLFSRYAGVSPKSYYNTLRVQAAAKMVLEGIPKTEIAEQLGFSSPNYFTMFFKKQMGMTPTEYQRKRSSILAD